jgi:group I intron endonuclease
MFIMGLIYRLTSPSGKSYIGQTTRTFEKRFQEHCSGKSGSTIIENALKKYGSESFTTEILLNCDDILLDENEISFIKKYDCIEPKGYNIRSGGSNGKHSEESKERMRQSKLGPNNPNYGKPRSDEFKATMKEKKSGKNHHFFGKTLSLEHKLALSVAHKKIPSPMYLVSIKARPEARSYGGYAVCNHPVLPNKHFTSKNSHIVKNILWLLII